jgi:hypothetical protein
MTQRKAYTNATFTKRVDYDGGRRRGAKAQAGPLVCERCGAAYLRRRWILASDDRAKLLRSAATKTICPACAMIRDGQVGGYLTLEGAFFAAHRAEIMTLVRNEAARAAEDNPLARIIRWAEEDDATTVTTTTEHLVQRLGKAVQSAYGGDIDFGFSHADKFARATWRRD